ncbi:MAG: hypothetical protein ABWZ58_03585 [Acidimicrobiia bacterium]
MRRLPHRAWPWLAFAALVVVSCGEAPAGETTTSSSAVITVTTVDTTVPSTTAPPAEQPVALSDLVGRWENEANSIVFDEGGSYELFELDADATETPTDVVGFVALQDGRLIFATSANPNPCSGETGVYDGELVGEVLHLSIVEDPCAFREEAFAVPFSQTTTSGPDAVISDLSGSWENERSVLRVNDGGDYIVLGPDADPDRPLTGGFVAREEGNFIFVSGVVGECPGQTGVYSADLEDDLLTLTVVDDPCAARVAWFEPVFTSATG